MKMENQVTESIRVKIMSQGIHGYATCIYIHLLIIYAHPQATLGSYRVITCSFVIGLKKHVHFTALVNSDALVDTNDTGHLVRVHFQDL